MIEISNPERFGAFRVQDYDKAIPVGWLVVAIGTTGTKASMMRHHGPNQNGYLMQGDDEIPSSKAVVLIGQLKDDTIAALAEAEAEAQREVARQTNLCVDAVKELERVTDKVATYVDQAKREVDSHRLTLGIAETTRTLCKRLEADIAKIRSHFGEKAMNEALAKP